ncbi:MAG: response regulator [Deltaproteobacteria bacterium]|nr:response regulator [Deltaproteobacteria bacterium]
MKNVLIVDDENRFILSLTAGLEAYKDQFNVFTAANGQKAIEFLTSKPIDLVVTDLRMPVMDGFELLAYLSSNLQSIPVIVMTAFATGDTKSLLKNMGTLRLFEKPINFDELANAIQNGLEHGFKGGSLTGISIGNFLQLIEMEAKTCLLEVGTDKDKVGHFYFKEGVIFDAFFNDLKGEDAALELIGLENVELRVKKPPKKRIDRRIKTSLISLLMEGNKRKDELEHNEKKPPDTGSKDKKEDPGKKQKNGTSKKEITNDQSQNSKGEDEMAKISEILAKFKEVDGFQAVGVFSPNGEMVAEANVTGYKLAELGALANDILLKAQKTTEIMGVGRGNMCHIQAPKAQIIVRCLNEATDFAANQSGRAHIHMVLILGMEGNLAMGKMKLDGVIQDLAPHFR